MTVRALAMVAALAVGCGDGTPAPPPAAPLVHPERATAAIARVRVGDAGLTVVDPTVDPLDPATTPLALAVPAGRTVEIRLARAAEAPGHVTAVLLTFDERAPDREGPAGTVWLDRGLVLVADAARLESRWAALGPAGVCALTLSASKLDLPDVADRALARIAAGGLALESTGERLRYRALVRQPAAELRRVNADLVAAGIPAALDVLVHDSFGRLEGAATGVAPLDAADDPWAVGFTLAEGGGTYWWTALYAGEELVGYRCVVK